MNTLLLFILLTLVIMCVILVAIRTDIAEIRKNVSGIEFKMLVNNAHKKQ